MFDGEQLHRMLYSDKTIEAERIDALARVARALMAREVGAAAEARRVVVVVEARARSFGTRSLRRARDVSSQ